MWSISGHVITFEIHVIKCKIYVITYDFETGHVEFYKLSTAVYIFF